MRWSSTRTRSATTRSSGPRCSTRQSSAGTEVRSLPTGANARCHVCTCCGCRAAAALFHRRERTQSYLAAVLLLHSNAGIRPKWGIVDSDKGPGFKNTTFLNNISYFTDIDTVN